MSRINSVKDLISTITTSTRRFPGKGHVVGDDSAEQGSPKPSVDGYVCPDSETSSPLLTQKGGERTAPVLPTDTGTSHLHGLTLVLRSNKTAGVVGSVGTGNKVEGQAMARFTVEDNDFGTVGGSLLSDNVVTNIPRPNEVDKGRSKNKDCRPSNNQIDRM